ncbi:PIG-L family deacetylase [Arthrobacter dokdonensis]|uniref:PIG-L family deacetylase n=1 Tax=Arthrobacter dokdonellae TaxID=2211210 RepID=UPI000DE5A373|nr:PIG-L family deacetylase [Arthrobacter dokdonellae]
METPTLLPGVGPGATLLFIHAHPDDETLVTGATMAAYAGAGARVVLLTCTRGELGEVIPPELGHLEVGRTLRLPVETSTNDGGAESDTTTADGATPADGAGLARERERELAAALDALGVREHLWLGQGVTAPATGPVVFRDSGMRWGADGRATAASTVLEGSLSRGPLAGQAALAAAAIRSLRPDAVVTYAADGGYGHPDHVRTHELAMAALELAARGDGDARGWSVPRVFAIVSDRPERPLETDVPRIAVAGDKGAKTAAMRAHRTQVVVDGERFALSDGIWRDISGVEEFVDVTPTASGSGAG